MIYSLGISSTVALNARVLRVCGVLCTNQESCVVNAAQSTRQLLKARLFFRALLLTLAIYNSQAFAVSEMVSPVFGLRRLKPAERQLHSVIG